MDVRRTPTVLEIARVLASSKTSDHQMPEMRHTARWLVAAVPEAREMWAELEKDPGDRPSMMELAKVVFATRTRRCREWLDYPEAEGTARWLIEQVPVVKEKLVALEELRRDAVERLGGFEWADAVAAWDHELDLVVEAERAGKEWKELAEIIPARKQHSAEENSELFFQQRYSICLARICRAGGEERPLLEEVKTRLESWLARRRERSRREQSPVEWLGRQGLPELPPLLTELARRAGEAGRDSERD